MLIVKILACNSRQTGIKNCSLTQLNVVNVKFRLNGRMVYASKYCHRPLKIQRQTH